MNQTPENRQKKKARGSAMATSKNQSPTIFQPMMPENRLVTNLESIVDPNIHILAHRSIH